MSFFQLFSLRKIVKSSGFNFDTYEKGSEVINHQSQRTTVLSKYYAQNLGLACLYFSSLHFDKTAYKVLFVPN